MAKNKKKPNVQKLSPENYIRLKARNLPVYECWLNSDWKKMYIAEIMIARIHANGNITWAIYMVDLLCRGVKDTLYQFNVTKEEYEDTLTLFIEKEKNIKKTDYVLVHNILYAASEYATGLGLQQHKDFKSVTQYMLKEDTDDIKLIKIECGRNGKPMLIQNDSLTNREEQKIINQLEKAVGKGNFDVIGGEDDYDMDTEEVDEEVDEDFTVVLDNEYTMMGFDEKRTLFLDMNNKDFTKLTLKERNKLIILTDNICLLDVCDYDIIGDLLINWKAEKEIEIVEDDYTTELLGIAPDRTISEEEIFDFIETDILIQESPGKAAKLLKNLRKRWGNIPFLCYLELKYLEVKKPKELESKLKEYITLYPDYPLLKLEVYRRTTIATEDPDKIIILDFNEIFRGRNAITNYEMFEFQVVKLSVLIGLKDINKIEAQNMIIDDLSVKEEYLGFIGSTVMLTKIKLLYDYLESF
jgi:hypothetical protein